MTYINSLRRPSQTSQYLSDLSQQILIGTLQLEEGCQSALSIVAIQPHYVSVDAVYIKLPNTRDEASGFIATEA